MIVLITIVLCTLLFVIVSLVKEFHTYNEQKKERMSFMETFNLTGFPIITFENNGKLWNFLLDTGSSNSIIDSTIMDELSYKPIKGLSSKVFGIDGKDTSCSFCNISLGYKDKSYESRFMVKDMSAPFKKIKEVFGVNLHGFLGSDFFRQYQYVINFDELVAYSKGKLKQK